MAGDEGGRPKAAALIPAAGSGQRMGGSIPKPYQLLGGREILARTLDVFEVCQAIDEVWLVVSADQTEYCREKIVERYGFQKVKGLVAGGAERQASVWRGLQQVSPEMDLVVVHDGVRPFLTASMLDETVVQAARHKAVTVAIPVKDTLKRVSDSGWVEATVSRDHLWRTQTPQVFDRQLLIDAFEHAAQHDLHLTDEAGLVEALGRPVHVVVGLEQNIKMTTPDDLWMGERFLQTEG